jgi:uncharacterized protein involved in exopolysaccharide biosynthesis
MFIFGRTAEARQVDAAAPRPAGSPSAILVLAVGIARRNFVLITAAGVGCGLLAFGAGELLTPRYVAIAQIYIDPSAMRGSDVQPIVPGRDSNSFVSYVESQALIAASQSVLERVVKAQNLDRDPEFSRSAGSSLFRRLMSADRNDEALDLIVCDGPGASEVEAASMFEHANAIVALDGAEEASTLEQLAGPGFAPGVLVRFEMHEDATRKIA